MDLHTRERAALLSDRVWIDHDVAKGDARARHVIERALQEQRVVALRYRDQRDNLSKRLVDPVLLAHAQNQWYFVAHCRSRNGIRWFRLDRVLAARLTAGPATDIPVGVVGTPPATAEAVGDF